MRPEVITGVGFCMYVTRAALDRCGFFDEEAFGRGYGEEVDLCLRATRQGMRHLVEDSTYVHHYGGVSFGDERRSQHRPRLAHHPRRYPHFREANKRERAHEPLRSSFTSLELGLSERDPSRPHVLQMLHSPPGALGGTEKHVTALLNGLVGEFDFSVLHPVESGFVLRTMWDRGDGTLTHHEHLLPRGLRRQTYEAEAGAALRMALDLFEFDAVHIQNLIGYSLAPLDVLADFDGPVVCSVRDLFLACPNHSLLYRNRQACGIPDDLTYCATCLPETKNLDLDDLSEFRRRVSSTPRHRRHLGLRQPKRRRLPATRLRHRPRTHPRSSPTAPSSPPTGPNPSTRASSSTNPSASPSSDAAGPRKASPPSTTSPTNWPTPPSRSTTSANSSNSAHRKCTPTAPTTTSSSPTCSAWPASRSCCSPATTPKPSATS